MKRRIIKGQGGINGIYPLTNQDVQDYQDYQAGLPETNMQKAARYTGYVLDPIGAAIDYVYNASWTPKWIRKALPYADVALAMAPKTGPKGRRGRKSGSKIAPKEKNPQNDLIRRNIEQFGEAHPRKSGAKHYNAKGDVVQNGDVGRPSGSGKSEPLTPYQQKVRDKLNELRKENGLDPIETSAPSSTPPSTPAPRRRSKKPQKKVSVNNGQRGRPSAATYAAIDAGIINEGIDIRPRISLKGNARRTQDNLVKRVIPAYSTHLRDLRAQLAEAIDALQRSEISTRIFHARSRGSTMLKNAHTAGYNDSFFDYPEDWKSLMGIKGK